MAFAIVDRSVFRGQSRKVAIEGQIHKHNKAHALEGQKSSICRLPINVSQRHLIGVSFYHERLNRSRDSFIAKKIRETTLLRSGKEIFCARGNQ